ncbi:hypothetical protein [Terracidiphilus sp.]|jgi:flagellar biosynthesis chaperone FliJ|uniref:hypothetical protein n=1 Tax=Terracidiphilus sp. TaxID=1964191 RepID=UPI003C17D4E1
MPVSSALKRLLRIRDLEQEQHQRALESALAELRQLERALEQAAARQRGGRTGFTASVLDQSLEMDRNPEQNSSRKPLERQSALTETTIGKRHALALAPRLLRAAAQAALRRQEFLSKRIERRQAETLIEETEAADALEANRKGQKSLDDWYLSRPRTDRRDSVLPNAFSDESEDFSNLP